MITIEWSPIFTVDVFKLIIWLSRFIYGTSKQLNLYLKLYSDQCFTTTDEKTIFSKSDMQFVKIYLIKRCFQSIRDYLTHLEGDTCKTLGNQENIAQR